MRHGSARGKAGEDVHTIGAVDIDRQVLVVAEIGNNHEGDRGLAEELIGRAAEAGAGAVKLQAIRPERLVRGDQAERLAQLRRLCLAVEDLEHLAGVAKAAGVLFLATPFDVDAVALLDPWVPAFKVASGDNDFVALLEAVGATGKPVLLSTGGTDLAGVRRAIATLESGFEASGAGTKRHPLLVLLHCVSAYPTPPDQANLRAITSLAALGHPVGYSDHTLGIEAAVLAVALGARVVEKHFTLSKTHSTFRDHQLSADPREMKDLVARVREVELLLGDGVKRIMEAERGVVAAARRSIVAVRDLEAGRTLSRRDLDWLRPGDGLPPEATSRLLERRLRRPVAAGRPLSLDDVE